MYSSSLMWSVDLFFQHQSSLYKTPFTLSCMCQTSKIKMLRHSWSCNALGFVSAFMPNNNIILKVLQQWYYFYIGLYMSHGYSKYRQEKHNFDAAQVFFLYLNTFRRYLEKVYDALQVNLGFINVQRWFLSILMVIKIKVDISCRTIHLVLF